MVNPVDPAPPVLLLVFNRPEQTQVAVDALLRERPGKIYVSGDGPRAHVPDDASNVAAVWELIHSAPWECELLEHRNERNLGVGTAVHGGLDWFFDHEPHGFVVEDDVDLAPGALALAAHLFRVGESDAQVGNITVFNTVPPERLAHPGASFRRSLFSTSQGWGTWANVWHTCPASPKGWRDWLPEQRLTELGGADLMKRWRGILDQDVIAHEHPTLFTWDFLWQAHLWATRPISLVSNVNLIRNTGFSSNATFSTQVPKWWPMESSHWSEPLVMPPTTDRDVEADRWEGRHRYSISRVHTMRRAVSERLPWVTERYRNLRYGHF